MPLEIAKISLQLDAAKVYGNSMFKVMQSVMKTKGPAGFMVGYVGTQYRQAAWGTGYFVSLAFFEEKVGQAFKALGIDTVSNPSAKTISQLTSGFFAWVFGAALNTPGDTIRSNVQKRILGGLPGATTFLGVRSFITYSVIIFMLYL